MTHSTLEFVQLMIKLFTLELQNNDPLDLASEVKSIMHDIKVTNVELDIPLKLFSRHFIPLTQIILSHCKQMETSKILPLTLL